MERGRRTQREQGRAQAGGQALAPPQDGAGSNAAPIEVDDTIAPGDLPTNPIELDDTLRPGDDPTTAIRVDDIPDDDDVVMSIENDLPRLGRHDIGGHDNNLVNGTTGGTNDNDSDLFLPDDPSQSTEEMLQRFQAAQNAQMLRKQRARVNPANQGRSQASSTQHAQQNQAQPGVQSNHRQPHEPASLANIRDNNSLTSNTSSEPTIDLTEDDLMNAIEID